jgi:hypothetical protein
VLHRRIGASRRVVAIRDLTVVNQVLIYRSTEKESVMSDAIPRRHVVARIAAFGLSGLAWRAAAAPAVSSESTVRPLAERLAAYADQLRYDDLEAATIERVKSHLILPDHLARPRREDQGGLSVRRRRGRGVEPDRAFGAPGEGAARPEAPGGLPGITPRRAA